MLIFNYKHVKILNPFFVLKRMVLLTTHYKPIIKLNMFWIKRKSPIQEDIKSFAISRKQYLTTNEQVSHISLFIKTLGVTKYEEISDIDIESYLNSISTSVSRESVRIQITQSIFLFVRFMKNNDINVIKYEHRGQPEKTNRNREILNLRKRNYTYKEIGKEYNINKSTAHNIVKRLNNKKFDLSTVLIDK
jgi:hypothetical protein